MNWIVSKDIKQNATEKTTWEGYQQVLAINVY